MMEKSGATELPGVEFREYQRECVDVLRQLRASGETRALVHMATGLGKTITITLDVHEFLKEQPQARVLFLCHRVEILDQAREVFEDKLASHQKKIMTFDPTAVDTSVHEADILFSTFQSMHSGNE